MSMVEKITNWANLNHENNFSVSIKKQIEIGKLKANNGQQNYEITGIDTKTYNVVVIYSKSFEIYFVLAKFSSM